MVQSTAELLRADDATIEDAVRYADPLALRGLVYQLTGDVELRDIASHKMVVGGFRDMYFVSEKADVALIRAKAATLLKSLRDAGPADIPIGPADRLLESLSLTTGVEVDPIELPIWLEELALDPFARGLEWTAQRPAGASDFTVLVIGAGMGGLNAAAHLKRAGVPFTVLEKNGSVGGTWYENRYPGARVDSPSRVYGHIYGVDFPRPYQYCPQSENEKYFNWVADRFDLRGDIQFHTEVRSIVWDAEADEWVVTADQGGESKILRANAVISAVGFLSRPNIPKLEGIEDFQGDWFHTARWPEGYDLKGKRVAVIGTGCTGYQTIPEIVKDADHVFVFQRTPNWIYEAPGYLDPYPDQVTWLDRNFPYHSNFARFQWSYMQRPQNTLKGLQVDPDFHDPHAVSQVNKDLRDQRIAFLTKKLGHRPDLLEKMTPKAPPMSARPVLVDADYSILDVLLRDDVTLVDAGVRRVTEDSIELPDGTRHEVDTIVLATGFRANDFLAPMDVRGQNGLRLADLWGKDGARAYLGSMLPGFPNFFMVYGPNTNLLSGMQIVDMEEVTTRFALESIAALIEQGKQTVEVTENAYWSFNAVLDSAEKFMTYVDPRANNYYQNEFGRSAANGPLDTRLLWNWLRDPAGRLSTDGPLPIDESLEKQYLAISPYFGQDLVVQ